MPEAKTDHIKILHTFLTRARKRKGITSQQLADLMTEDSGREKPYSRQTVYNWEHFRAHPSIDVYASWARALGFRLVVDVVEGEVVPLSVSPHRVETFRSLNVLEDDALSAALQFARTWPYLTDSERRVRVFEMELILDREGLNEEVG